MSRCFREKKYETGSLTPRARVHSRWNTDPAEKGKSTLLEEETIGECLCDLEKEWGEGFLNKEHKPRGK